MSYLVETQYNFPRNSTTGGIVTMQIKAITTAEVNQSTKYKVN